jgi:hypothetical protein
MPPFSIYCEKYGLAVLRLPSPAQQILELQGRMKKLREEGKDRPLHWEKWKDPHEALGPIPYGRARSGAV